MNLQTDLMPGDLGSREQITFRDGRGHAHFSGDLDASRTLGGCSWGLLFAERHHLLNRCSIWFARWILRNGPSSLSVEGARGANERTRGTLRYNELDTSSDTGRRTLPVKRFLESA
jgi:hypothetical protein